MTATPYTYGAGTRLSSLYTAGLDGKPLPSYATDETSAGYKAWKAGRDGARLATRLRQRLAELEAEDANDPTSVEFHQWRVVRNALARLEGDREVY